MVDAHNRAADGRYEFRVWAGQGDARDRLARMADVERDERLDDCYLLVANPLWNAKIRANRLKVKRLVGVTAGFQRWSSRWYRDDIAPPAPFAELLDTVSGDEPITLGSLPEPEPTPDEVAACS